MYPIVDGIPHFIETQPLTGLNKRFSQMYDWFSWGYRFFSKLAFAYIGMTEEQARREITDRLALFDKFLPEGQSLGLLRNLLGSLFRFIGTDINRSLCDVLGNTEDMRIEIEEPSLFFGQYRILKFRKQ